MKIYILPLLLLCFNVAVAQDHVQRCHSTEIHEAKYASDPNYRHYHDTRMAELDELMEISSNQGRLDCIAPIIIPVAVHYEGVGSQSMSCLRDLALSQIEALNRDFSASNPDIVNFENVVAQTEMTESQIAAEGVCVLFCLADADHPDGFGLDDGDYAITINLDYVANNNFPNFTNGAWAGYFNIFVTEGTGVLGYSPLFGNANGSGIVVEACAFGLGANACGGGIGPGQQCPVNISVYNTGRTSVHEAGHYLGLNHVWGPGNQGTGSCNSDDGFSDTPNTDSETFGCPPIGQASCGSADMHMNYMDYVNDECMYMFSEQQAVLMYNSASSIWGPNTIKCSASVTQNDAGISNIVFPSGTACGTTVAPIVTLRNIGQNDLTSVEIIYSAVGAGSSTFNWTGSLQQNEVENVFLPAIASPSTNYVLNVNTNNPNGAQDENPTNDDASENIAVESGVNLPFTEGFENFNNPFPDQGSTIFNPDEDDYAWDRRPGASAYANGVYSIYFDNHAATNGIGKEDWFILPEMNVSGFNSVNFTYDYAYTYFSDGTDARFDTFKIMYSLSCSNVWEEVYSDGGISLSTAPATSSFYLPNANSDWVNRTVGINTGGNDFLRVALVNVSGRGNNLFVDNINIQGSSAVVSNSQIESLNTFNVSPNPTNGRLNLDIQFDQLMDYEIRIHDAVGRNVYSATENDIAYQNDLNISHLSNGIYFVSVIAGDKIVTKKVLLAK